jgi:hypothetical protein
MKELTLCPKKIAIKKVYQRKNIELVIKITTIIINTNYIY